MHVDRSKGGSGTGRILKLATKDISQRQGSCNTSTSSSHAIHHRLLGHGDGGRPEPDMSEVEYLTQRAQYHSPDFELSRDLRVLRTLSNYAISR